MKCLVGFLLTRDFTESVESIALSLVTARL